MQPVIPCQRNPDLERLVAEFAETLKTQSHTLGNHGLSERDFYESGLFRGAIERIRGQYSAIRRDKIAFMREVLNHMQDRGFISSYDASAASSRHGCTIEMPGGQTCALAIKGCLDGNNTTIFERPPHASDFVLWSMCLNPEADPRLNAWSGIHTRLSAEIVDRRQQVDGVVIWDWLCGTASRPCPKLTLSMDVGERLTDVGPYRLTPPCIYLLPATVPSVSTDPDPPAHALKDVPFLDALHRCFGGRDDEVNAVSIAVSLKDGDVVRRTTVTRAGGVVLRSKPTAIRRR